MRASWLLLVLGWIASAFALGGSPNAADAESTQATPTDRFAGVPPPPTHPCNIRKQKWQKVTDDMTAYVKELRARGDNVQDFIAYADRHNLHNDNIHLLRTYIRCCPFSKDDRVKHIPWNNDTKQEYHLPWRNAPPPELQVRGLDEPEYEGLEARAAPSPDTCERDIGRMRAETLKLLKQIPGLEYKAEEADAHYHEDIGPPKGSNGHMARQQVQDLIRIHARIVEGLWRCCPMLDNVGPLPRGLKPFPSVPKQPPWPQPKEYPNYTEPVIDEWTDFGEGP